MTGLNVFLAPLLMAAPTVDVATYHGGSSDEQASGTAVDAAGIFYLSSYTDSIDFPTVAALQPNRNGYSDAWVSKFDPTMQTLLWSTYIGGGLNEELSEIAFNTSGDVILVGDTRSLDFPVTVGAYQGQLAGLEDVVVLALAADGSRIVWATYIGGSAEEDSWSLELDRADRPVISGSTRSPDFPVVRPLQPTQAGDDDGFVAILSPDGRALEFSTFLGGAGYDTLPVALPVPDGTVVVAGYTYSPGLPVPGALQPTLNGSSDGYIAVIDPAVPAILRATYLGGSGDDSVTWMARDPSGILHLAANTSSTDIPLVAAAQSILGGPLDAWILALDPDLGAIRYSTYLGGDGYDFVQGIDADACGNVVVNGVAGDGFPQRAPFSAPGGGGDAFVARFDAAGALLWSSDFGGSGRDGGLAVVFGPGDLIYTTGHTGSTNLPVRNARQPAYAGNYDGYVLRLSDPVACVAPTAVGNSLLAARPWPARDLHLEWSDVVGSCQASYEIWSDTDRSGPLATRLGVSPGGRRGYDTTLPVEPLLFLRVAGTSPCGRGPK